MRFGKITNLWCIWDCNFLLGTIASEPLTKKYLLLGQGPQKPFCNEVKLFFQRPGAIIFTNRLKWNKLVEVKNWTGNYKNYSCRHLIIHYVVNTGEEEREDIKRKMSGPSQKAFFSEFIRYNKSWFRFLDAEQQQFDALILFEDETISVVTEW